MSLLRIKACNALGKDRFGQALKLVLKLLDESYLRAMVPCSRKAENIVRRLRSPDQLARKHLEVNSSVSSRESRYAFCRKDVLANYQTVRVSFLRFLGFGHWCLENLSKLVSPVPQMGTDLGTGEPQTTNYGGISCAYCEIDGGEGGDSNPVTIGNIGAPHVVMSALDHKQSTLPREPQRFVTLSSLFTTHPFKSTILGILMQLVERATNRLCAHVLFEIADLVHFCC
jgi:hypothetical protein